MKANGFDFLLHESTNSRAVSHVPAVIWPLAIDSWLQHLFSAAVNFLIPLLANLEEMCCYKFKLPSRVWREWQDKLCEGSLHRLQFKQTYQTVTKKNPNKHNKKTLPRNKQKLLHILEKLNLRELLQEQIKCSVYLYHRKNSGMQSCPKWSLYHLSGLDVEVT